MDKVSSSFGKRLRRLIEEELNRIESTKPEQRQSIYTELESYRICDEVLEDVVTAINEHLDTC